MPDSSPVPAAPAPGQDTVVLLHGLGLRRWAMATLARALRADGYRVVNLNYPSRTVPLERLAGVWLPERLGRLQLAPGTRLHFVTHSMGGIIVRMYEGDPAARPLGRVVMLAPPNRGSAVVDHLRGFPPFRWFTGVNGVKLGAGPDALPRRLGPWPAARGELGVIAGSRSLNPLFSAWLEGPDDGKVAVASTRLEGMSDHVVLHHSHTWLQWHKDTADQVRAFLRHGRFIRDAVS